MNDNQKKLAIEIINFIKVNNNSVLKNKLFRHFDISKSTEFIIEWKYVLSNLTNEYKFLKIEGEMFSLTKKGTEFTTFEDFETKENLEIEKLKVDLILAQKMLKEYPYTKWFARISIVIALGLGVLEIIRYIKGK
jgi:hypothetical protein